jgi:hypothetical protein
MSAAWLDAFTKTISFDGGSSTAPPDAASRLFRLECAHLFSLLHGVAFQFLRSDWELGNIAAHDQDTLPAWDALYAPNYKPHIIDYFVLRSLPSRRLKFNAAFPIPVVGALGEEEAALLGLGQQVGWERVGSRAGAGFSRLR